MIFTQPVGALRALPEYRSGTFPAKPSQASLLPVPLLAPGLAGFGLAGSF